MIAVIVLPLALIIMILIQFLAKPNNNTKANENNKLIQNVIVQPQSKNENYEDKSAIFDDTETNTWAARGAGAGLVLGAIRGFVYDRRGYVLKDPSPMGQVPRFAASA